MTTLFKMTLFIFIFYISEVVAQSKVEDTLRAGSGGSAGTTQQGPAYDAGVTGSNAAMGGPDMTAIDKKGTAKKTKKKPVGTLRVDSTPSGGNLPPPVQDSSDQR